MSLDNNNHTDKTRPTPRALDAGDSAAFSSSFLASSFFCSQAESTSAPAPVLCEKHIGRDAIRWAVYSGQVVMKRNTKIIVVSTASLILVSLIFNSFYSFYFQEIAVVGLKFKPEGSQEPGTSPYSGSRIYFFNILKQTFIPVSPENMDAREPAWSPDGKLLAYSYVRDNQKSGIAVFKGNGQTKYFDFPTEVSNFDYRLAWSPDSQSILFLHELDGCHQFKLLNIDDGSFKAMDGVPNICEEYPLNIAWLSDGSIILEMDRNIYILDINTQSLVFITEGYGPFPNPREKWVTYVCEVPNKRGQLGYTGLCEIMVDGKNRKILSPSVHSFDISWTSGAKYIGFLNATGAESDHSYLTIIDMKTKSSHNIYQITGRGRREISIAGVAWRP